MISFDHMLDQLFTVSDLMMNATCHEEAEHYQKCAYACAVAVMMMSGDLSELPVAQRS